MASISVSGTGCAAPMRGWATARGGAIAAAAWLLLGAASPVARLDVRVDALRSDKGLIQLCLTSDPTNFPNCVDDARALRRSVPATARSLRFDALPVGTYAVAVIHDENGNAKLDTVMGIPREGFGFSRNPAIGFGPPRFTAARFALDADGTAQDIRMRYLL